ncbi:POT family-domain-containing protein [Aspergillus cavernicola]|uniref:POT family-domain-containing protein n=1 Tax=Aspergillus cavernicola TaxID=176166 RepID=A0ABR4IKW2_9EURO
MNCNSSKQSLHRAPLHKKSSTLASNVSSSTSQRREYPTVEELSTLRRVSGKVRWAAYTIAFAELCERFAYYGTTAVFTNYIQQPRPLYSGTGAGFSGQSGALGQGQRAATGLNTFNTFWCYFMPIIGAWIADEFWGRLVTIQASIAFAMLGHIVLIASAIPIVMSSPDSAFVCFSVGLVIFGIGVGGFKSNIAPLIAEQHKDIRPYIRVDDKTNERFIVDPAQTITRVFLYFYFMINLGALVGSVGMVYAEKYIGFWLAFLLPTVMFSLCPVVLFVCRHKYYSTPPTGSVVAKAFRLWALAMKPHWTWNPRKLMRNCKAPGFWENVKPSNVRRKPYWMTFDDQWVDEVRRACKACSVFTWYPIYWLAYGQMASNLTSQAATMELHGAPNDIISNIDPLALIIFIPIMDQFIYPGIRRLGYNFTPIKKIWVGYMIASISMIAATVIQYHVYKFSDCRNRASTCETPSRINVWIQTVPYVLIAFSEIFTSITGYEYAYTKAPKNMKSLVQSLYLFTNAISAVIQQALTALSADPVLMWNYGFIAVLAFFGGNFFYYCHRNLDKEEDELNQLEPSTYLGRESKNKEDRDVER